MSGIPRPEVQSILAAAAAAIDGGALGEGEGLLRRVLGEMPAHGGAKLLLARARRFGGDFESAATLAEEAGRQMPRDPAPRLEAALAYAAAGRYARAEVSARKALRLAPGMVPGLLVLAEVLRLAGKPDQALVEARRAAALAPGAYEARFAHANALFDAQRFEDAAAEFEAASRLRPELIDALYNRARALINLGRPGEAELLLRQCVELQPGAGDAYENLAAICGGQNRFDELFALCDLGIERCANPGPLWQLKADWHLILGRADDCLACHTRAIAIEPESDAAARARLRTNHALALLTMGRNAQGWREMRWRWDRASLASRHPNFAIDPSALPRDLSAKRVLIVQEQGLGDELFFLRYAPLLRTRGALLSYQGESKMHALLGGRRDLFERLLAPQATPEGADIVVLSGDVPEAAGGDIVAPLPLVADPTLLAHWKERLAALGPPPYLGVTWSAGLGTDESFRLRRQVQIKQVPVEDLGAALRGVPGTVIVLQRNPVAGTMARFRDAIGRQAHDLSALNEKMEDMLALLRLLDQYVCVSNANTHFAASLGLACRVLVMRWPEWRWRATGVSSPWFPGARLYRQQADGGWAAPLERLRGDLLNPG